MKIQQQSAPKQLSTTLSTKKMFSVIIPLYNKAAYVEKAIRSVLDQTYREFELIVVDDGSTDDGSAKVKRLFSTLTPPFGGWGAVSQPNQGVSVARNNGVKVAKYDYIAFLDADDWWEPVFLEEMKGLIEEFPEAGIYGSSYYIVKNGRKRVAPIGVAPDFKSGIINYCRVYASTLCMPLSSISVIIPKAIFEQEKGFKPGLKLGEDFDLWIRMALNYPVAFLNKSLAYYNQDVELEDRAIGGKLYEVEQHMLFNLDYLETEEKRNPDLKQLLDNLRVYSLLPYYLVKKRRQDALRELKKVDWNNQSRSAKLQYRQPVFLLKAYRFYLKLGSRVKQWIISHRNSNLL